MDNTTDNESETEVISSESGRRKFLFKSLPPNSAKCADAEESSLNLSKLNVEEPEERVSVTQETEDLIETSTTDINIETEVTTSKVSKSSLEKSKAVMNQDTQEPESAANEEGQKEKDRNKKVQKEKDQNEEARNEKVRNEEGQKEIDRNEKARNKKVQKEIDRNEKDRNEEARNKKVLKEIDRNEKDRNEKDRHEEARKEIDRNEKEQNEETRGKKRKSLSTDLKGESKIGKKKSSEDSVSYSPESADEMMMRRKRCKSRKLYKGKHQGKALSSIPNGCYCYQYKISGLKFL